ncbi:MULTISPECIES: hypothetical protein [Halobacterium]|uniref:hypothetical protein n=1 Tax=Halobacterium TaxID=2239 RepID=UPI00073E2F4B|nr:MULTISPECIES: hypothetical protein [Halobacterium]MCG1002985.1 hypothetical protein [Halobacterium noricense]
MDSISPEVVRTAGNHTVDSAARTFFGKLMDTFWLGTSTLALSTPRASPYHRANQSSSRSGR